MATTKLKIRDLAKVPIQALVYFSLLTSCNTKEIKSLKETNDSLQIANNNLNEHVQKLEQRIIYLEQFEPNPLIRNLDDKEVIQTFIDHNKFYNADVRFKNLKVIKTSYDVYDISYSAMNVSGKYLQEWSHGISRLTVYPYDKYKITFVKGPLLASP